MLLDSNRETGRPVAAPLAAPSARLLGALVVMAITAALAAASPTFANGSPSAVNDVADHLARTFTFDVLANDTEPDGEALTLSVIGHTCPNTVIATDGLIQVQTEPDDGTPRGYSVACAISYRVEDETGHGDTAVLQLTAQAFPLFSDGFESGGVSAWSHVDVTSPAEDL